MILCLSDLWPPFPGGAERLMFNIARWLHQHGQQVHVLTGYHAAQQGDGPPVQLLSLPSGECHAEGAAALTAYLRAARPRVVLTHHHYAAEFGPELVASGIPLVQVVLNGRRLPEAALAVYISEWVRDTVGGAQPQDLVLTPPAFGDVVADTHGPAIGFVKPLPHKGAHLVYQVAAQLPRRPFVVLRGEWQGLEVLPERPLRNVTFMEPVVDIRDFWRECRLVLVPSLSEDAGTVAQEATMNGLPCLSSAAGGLAETNAGGVLLDPRRPGQWVQAIRRLDRQAAYDEVVARQQAHLAATDHEATLGMLTMRIGAL